ncbi:MAG: SIS domain-containing protein [Candidatus Limiplasma sp.]|nr:SIS domain-containing protein [Candidatus Limiplasma sp.]
MFLDDYYNKVRALQEEVYADEREGIRKAAEAVAATVAADGILHVFGCGHSHMLTEEAFYRAGGLVQVNAILDSAVMLHEGAVKSSAVERMSGYACHIIDRFDVREGDVMLLFSTSGINSLPIEMAEAAKKKKMTVIVVSSSTYDSVPSRHSSGKRLHNCGDIVINNHVPLGDAVLSPKEIHGSIVPSSTVINAMILNMIIAQTAEELLKAGCEPKFFKSGNLPGGDEINNRYIQEYKNRIKLL